MQREDIQIGIIWLRLIIAGGLLLVGVLFALFFLLTGQFMLCLFALGVCAFFAGWPAGGVIKAFSQVSNRNR